MSLVLWDMPRSTDMRPLYANRKTPYLREKENVVGYVVGYSTQFGIIVPLCSLTCDFDLKSKSTISIIDRLYKVHIEFVSLGSFYYS